MAFVTTFVSTKDGQSSNAYNIDFSVGAGVRGNLPEDIMLVQALFRIVHFEVPDPMTPPPGETGIEVDGVLTPGTLRFMLHLQRKAKQQKMKVLLDGVFDPFRAQGQLSTIAKVQYVMEILNHTAFGLCKAQGVPNYDELPNRDDIPATLGVALNSGRRAVARKYESAFAH